MPTNPLLAELWISASRVCENCDIRVEAVAQPPGWLVTIKRRAPADGGAVTAQAEHLVEAIIQAVRKAEHLGL